MLAPMALGWVRATQTNFNNSGFFGSLQMITLADQQTVRRSYWNIGLMGTWVNPGQYPPGGSILRVGYGYFEDGLAPLSTPTPISNADQDWLDIETLYPDIVLDSSVDQIWAISWTFKPDQSVKSQRKNETGNPMGLYVCWEFALHDELSGFTIPWWTSSLDALINTP